MCGRARRYVHRRLGALSRRWIGRAITCREWYARQQGAPKPREISIGFTASAGHFSNMGDGAGPHQPARKAIGGARADGRLLELLPFVL